MAWFVYILRCSGDQLYVGSTSRLEERLDEHQNGRGGKYTSEHRPVTLAYTEAFTVKSEALARERQLKGWTRLKKEALITSRKH